jgi:pyridoxine 5'-phosphate synthase PdxJ
MLSPPVQPMAASRSGISGVATIELLTQTNCRFNSGRLAAQAFVAMTTRSAVTVAFGVRILAGRDLSIPVAGVFS